MHTFVGGAPLIETVNDLHCAFLTLSRPVIPNDYTSECSGPYWSNPPFLVLRHSGTLALKTEHQSARMSWN